MKGISFYNIMSDRRNDCKKNKFNEKTSDISDEKIIGSFLEPMLDNKNNDYLFMIESLKLIFKICLT